MKAKKVIYITTAVLTMALAVCAYAATMDKLSYVEQFRTGKVDIDIQELTVLEEGESAATQNIIDANKDVSYVPRIINRSADCFVRAHVEVVMDGECERPLSIDDIYGLSSDWICKDNYFYYTKILREGQQTDLFEGIHIPEDWDYGDAEGFSIEVKAEAVQSANFMPDFNKELPWGAVELTAAAKAEGNDYMEAKPISLVSDAAYTSGGGFQCNTSELFDGFENIMPGSKYEKTVNLQNDSKGTLKVSLEVAAKDSELNRKLQLNITAGDAQIYNGTVAAAGNLSELNIMEIARGNSGALKMELELPADADNAYIEMQDDIVWTLTADEIPDESVQTGDMSNIIPYVVAALLAVISMMIIMRYKRKGEDGTSH